MSRRSKSLYFICCAASLTFGSVLEAQAPADSLSLSLAEARARALESNPDLRAAYWRSAAARGDLRGARLIQFNPDVLFESRTSGDGLTSRYEAEVGLEIEIANQRGPRTGAAQASVASSSSGLNEVARRLLAEVGYAYSALAAAERRLALISEIGAFTEQLLRAVRTQLAEGEVSVLEANLATIEGARARARALEAASARTTAALELERVLGLDPTGAVRMRGPAEVGVEESEGRDASMARALTVRPDLRAAELDVERARQEARLVRRESFPNLRVAGLVTREDPLADPRLGVSVGIQLPLFNRNQGLSDRRKAEIVEVEQLRRSTELRVRTEVEDAVRAYESAQREVTLLETELLEPIRQNQGLLEIAYREGKIDLASLLLVRNQLLDAELGYWDAWERRERAHTDLQSATGDILRGVTITEGSYR